MELTAEAEDLLARTRSRRITVAIIGMGYVGLPLAMAFGASGVSVLGFDVDPEKVSAINAGKSYIKHISDALVKEFNDAGLLSSTDDFSRIGEADAILICVPTPLSQHHEPDLRYVVSTTEIIAGHIRPSQIVILESTTYPGTTKDVMKPILERSGLEIGKELFLAYSPEREDPGNIEFSTSQIPKVVGADDASSRAIASALYDLIVPATVIVSTTATAEAVKITENVFRAVNIALVNELKVVFDAMDINIWEVIDAAKTKPFGFMPFYPGPGLGGHCIPIDPFYLTWKAREFNQHTRFIELAGQINSAMPQHVVRRLSDALDARFQRGLNGARILLLGIAYKKNVDDIRESPSLTIMELLEARGATADFYDPHVTHINNTREHPTLNFRSGIDWDLSAIANYDAVLICTDHDAVDYGALVKVARLVVDTRNACARAGAETANVVRA